MPILNITWDELGPHRCTATLSYIAILMLWPDDPEQRDRAWRAIGAAQIEKHVLDEAPNDILFMTNQQLREVLSFTLTAPRLPDVSEESQRPNLHGAAAGLILGHVLHRRDTGRAEARLGAVMDDVSAKLSGVGGIRLSRKTLEAASSWPRFRCVAHLWMAHLWAATTSGEPTFPCRLDKTADFLAVAEWYRVEGEGFKPKYSDTPLLPADATWRMPSAENLPKLK
jgi:hypothetical protein